LLLNSAKDARIIKRPQDEPPGAVSFLRCVPTELQRFDHFGVTQHQGQKQLGAHHDNEPEIPR
jgi:hypothetical protein